MKDVLMAGYPHLKSTLMDVIFANGAPEYKQLRGLAYQNYSAGQDLCVIVYDRRDVQSLSRVSEWLAELRQHTDLNDAYKPHVKKKKHKKPVPLFLLGVDTQADVAVSIKWGYDLFSLSSMECIDGLQPGEVAKVQTVLDECKQQGRQAMHWACNMNDESSIRQAMYRLVEFSHVEKNNRTQATGDCTLL
jgi:hypothetical protein